MNKELQEIKKRIEQENISLNELAYLHQHKQQVLDTGDILLCQWADISEQEYNKGELLDKNRDLDILLDRVDKGEFSDSGGADRLAKECEKYDLDFDDILNNGYNSCDRCGAMDNSQDLRWVDSFEPSEYVNDRKALKGIELEQQDYCAICDKCYVELVGKGNKQ